MFTKISTIEELKEIFIERFLNETDKVSKVSPGSVLNAVSFGVSKIGQKVQKDIALLEANLFPDAATGFILDNIAVNFGVAPRFGASQSSGYVRINATPGTQYLQGIQIFQSSGGQSFELTEDFTVPAQGFGYAKLRSQQPGEVTNVDPLTITRVSPQPVGHQFVVNEYQFTGGRNIEQDEFFRQRIKEAGNRFAVDTISRLQYALQLENNNILRIFKQGKNNLGQIRIGIATQNGIDLTQNELEALKEKAQKYLSISDYRDWGQSTDAVEFFNMPYYPIDLSANVILETGAVADEVRKAAQINVNKYFDIRNIRYNQRIEWDDIFVLLENTRGIKYVFDEAFILNGTIKQDFRTPINTLPRVRSFLLRDENGGIISDGANALNPIYYPSIEDISFQATVLNNI